MVRCQLLEQLGHCEDQHQRQQRGEVQPRDRRQDSPQGPDDRHHQRLEQVSDRGRVGLREERHEGPGQDAECIDLQQNGDVVDEDLGQVHRPEYRSGDDWGRVRPKDSGSEAGVWRALEPVAPLLAARRPH